MTKPKTQADKFRQAAEELQCDPDEKRWEEKLRKVASAKEKRDADPKPE